MNDLVDKECKITLLAAEQGSAIIVVQGSGRASDAIAAMILRARNSSKNSTKASSLLLCNTHIATDAPITCDILMSSYDESGMHFHSTKIAHL